MRTSPTVSIVSPLIFCLGLLCFACEDAGVESSLYGCGAGCCLCSCSNTDATQQGADMCCSEICVNTCDDLGGDFVSGEQADAGVCD